MAVLSANQFPGAEQQALAYPGLRPKFSYVYYQNKVYEIMPGGDSYGDMWVDDRTAQVSLDDFLAKRGNPTLDQRHAVLAVGSNGCPGRLAEKYRRQPEVALPVFVGSLADAAVVYSRRLVIYGALPATYLYQARSVSWLSVTMLTGEQLEHMDTTEDLGRSYLRIEVPGQFRVKDGPRISGLTAYLDRNILTYRGKPVRLKMFARQGPDWPIMDEPEVLSLVFDQAGLLLGEPIETRHSRLVSDKTLKQKLARFLDMRMGALSVDKEGHLVDEHLLRGSGGLTTEEHI